jgi:plastocyanin
MKLLLWALLAWPLKISAGEIQAVVKEASGKPVRDAVVFIYEVKGATFAAPSAPAVMNQIRQELVPHVLPVLAGTSVRFPNQDNIHHQLYSFSKTKTFELPLYKDTEPKPVLMDKSGIVTLGCGIHDWMRGYILVLDNPYFAKTGDDGAATLTGVPEGEYRVVVWSERLKEPVEATSQNVTVGPQPAQVQFPPKLGPVRKSTRPVVSGY